MLHIFRVLTPTASALRCIGALMRLTLGAPVHLACSCVLRWFCTLLLFCPLSFCPASLSACFLALYHSSSSLVVQLLGIIMSTAYLATSLARISRRTAVQRQRASVACLDHWLLPSSTTRQAASTGSNVPQLKLLGAIRCKHAKTGKHIETLNELAHEKSRDEAQARRDKKKDRKAAKKGKKGKEEAATPAADVSEDDHEDDWDDNDDEEEDDENPLPDPEKVKQKMAKIVNSFEESLKAIRGSEPTPELFDDVMVDAYGSLAPLKSVAQVVIATPTQATATCFDPATAKAVSAAIRDKLSLNPSVEDGGVVKIPLPRVSMETRQKTATALSKKAEIFRQRVRKVRRKTLDVVKQGVAGKLEHVSKDDAFRVQKEVEELADKVVHTLNDLTEKKHETIMAV